MTPQWYEKIKRVLEIDEGYRKKVYDCGTGKEAVAPIGKLTIGIGHNLQDNGLSDTIIDQLFFEDVAHALESAYRIFSIEIFESFNEVRQHCLIAMIFAMGEPKFKEFQKLIKFASIGSFEKAAAEILDSQWAVQVKHERSLRMFVMMKEGRYPDKYNIENVAS